MSDPKQRKKTRKIKIDDLEVNKETLQNLTESEAEQVEGGRRLASDLCEDTWCGGTCSCASLRRDGHCS